MPEADLEKELDHVDYKDEFKVYESGSKIP